MQLNVKNIKDRKTWTVEVKPEDCVGDLKIVIETATGFAPAAQRLVFKGKGLKEGVPLSDQGIQKDATLHLVMRLKTYVELKVRVMSGKTIDLDTDPRAPIDDVVGSLVELLALDARPRVIVSADGQRFESGGQIDQHGVLADGSMIYLILVPLPNLASDYAALGLADGAEADRARAYGMVGSLYSRCGGAFGIASFVDRCMDAWMADETLNANDAVATWHGRAQRCGFKFLVTQLMGYLTGGPQTYTGIEMAASHKHLAISGGEWTEFVERMREVCEALGLLEQEVADVTAVIASMRTECVLGEGERAPRNPGHPVPAGGSLYAKLGGVYPIALFCDRVVDALLSDRTVKVPLDAMRTAATLKYFFTELVCARAGGPETMTAPSLAETHLLVSSKELFQLLRCAEAASDHVRDGALRTRLMQLLSAERALLLDPTRTESDDPHGYVEQIARIAKETRVPMEYVVGGGAVFFAGRDFHFGDASPLDLKRCWDELRRLGFRRQRVLAVKSANDAAAM